MKRMSSWIALAAFSSIAIAQTSTPGREPAASASGKAHAESAQGKTALGPRANPASRAGSTGSAIAKPSPTPEPDCQQWRDLIRPAGDDSEG